MHPSVNKVMILNTLSSMQIGQECLFDVHDFEAAYPCGCTSIYNNSREAFLSSMIGSSVGAWTCELTFDQRHYKVGRHKEGNKTVYVDPDRAYLFNRQPDGSLERNDIPYHRRQ